MPVTNPEPLKRVRSDYGEEFLVIAVDGDDLVVLPCTLQRWAESDLWDLDN